MKIPRLITRMPLPLLTFITFLIGLANSQMQSLYSPSYGRAYLKLSTSQILPIDYNSASVSINFGDSVSSGSLINPPTSGNYTLALINGELYSFCATILDKSGKLAISKLWNNQYWLSIDYNATDSQTIKYFDYPTIMTSVNNGTESVFLYGGVSDNGITTRMLEFNPSTKDLTIVVTSSSPTAFYGGANCALDSTGISNLIIGGKAGSGWLSMFQIATWEYKTWSFKAVQSASFSVNSRINPLVLPVFKQNDQQQDLNDISSVMVIGGSIASKYSTPYVLNLNVTNDWNYKNYTGVGDFQFSTDLLGAIVVNDTLITVTNQTSSSMNKRSSTGTTYNLDLYDVGSLRKVSAFQYNNAVVAASSSSSSSSSSAGAAASSSTDISSSSTEISSSTITSTYSAYQSSLIIATPTSAPENRNRPNATPIVLGVVIPIVSLILLSLLGYYIFKKFFQSNNIEIHSINTSSSITSSDEPDYFKEVRNLEKDDDETHSISSWEHKRSEFQESLQRHSTNSQTSIFLQSNKSKDSVPLTHSPNPVSPSRKKNWRNSLISMHSSTPSKHQINLNLDELENSDTQDPFNPLPSMGNKRNSFRLKKIDDQDEEIDEFLGDRDVQVLVSSKRRSKLRITNPDLKRNDSLREVDEETEFESMAGSSVVGSSLGFGSSSLGASSSDIFNVHPEEGTFYKSLIEGSLDEVEKIAADHENSEDKELLKDHGDTAGVKS